MNYKRTQMNIILFAVSVFVAVLVLTSTTEKVNEGEELSAESAEKFIEQADCWKVVIGGVISTKLLTDVDTNMGHATAIGNLPDGRRQFIEIEFDSASPCFGLPVHGIVGVK